MTCKDCICYEGCYYRHDIILGDCIANGCPYYKDKSRFVELPCKPCDKVYAVWNDGGCLEVDLNIHELEVYGITKNKYGIWISFNRGDEYFSANDLGRIYFLTKAEAEKALEERKREKNA